MDSVFHESVHFDGHQHALMNIEFANDRVYGGGNVLAKTLPQAHQRFCRNAHGWGPFTDQFSLTLCFVDGAVLIFPSLFMLVLGWYQVYTLYNRKPMPSSKGWRVYLKLILVGVQFLFAFISAVQSAKGDFVHNVSFLSPVASMAAVAVAFAIHYLESDRSLISNGILLFYWLFESFAQLVKTINLYEHGTFATRRGYSTVYAMCFANSVIILLMEWLLPRVKSAYESMLDEDRNPVEFADIFSRLTFSWMSGMMKRGYNTYLNEDDLPDLPNKDATGKVSQQFEQHWQKQVKNKKSPSLSIPLVRSFGVPFVAAGVFKALQDILAFVQPQLLRVLITFVNDYNDNKDVPLSKGLFIAFAMFFVSVMQTAVLHQYFQRAFETGMRFKSALTASVFRKSLVLSNEDRAGKTTGDIVNLMAVDTQRLQDLTQYGQIIWSGPFQILLCLGSLYNLLGNTMWAGVVVMIVMIPVNTWIAKVQKGLQQKQMKNKDQRTRITSEILTNIKSLKLYGWEVPFMDRLNYVRNDLELKTLKDIGMFSATTTFLWNCAPFMVSCSTFALFVYTQDQPLTTDIVFPALTLFNLLSFPLSVVPMVVTAIVEASVSVQRLRDFLTAEELQPDAVERLPRANDMGQESVTVDSGVFVWERKNEYKVALDQINFSAHKGELACIVGRVGSGKSSLLQSILGDLYRVEGSVKVRGKVAYAAQMPWIMNASVKDNILFGCKYDPEFYQETIRACALTDDFAILPDGDETVVGEKGISLSGGQKARLSLARAVYARADVYLLDDPLSAVDEHVKRHLIDNLLSRTGLLSTKTVVLATNAIAVLGQADKVYMLSGGKIVESGSYDQVMERQGQLYQLISEYGKKNNGESDASSSTLEPNDDELVQPYTGQQGQDEDEGGQRLARRSSNNTLRRASTASFTKPRVIDEEAQAKQNKYKEHSEQGKVSWQVYKDYARASNIPAVVTYLVILSLSQILQVSGNVWLKHWSEVNTERGANPDIGKYLGVYAGFGVSASAMVAVQTMILMVYCAIHAARIMHSRMLNSVLAAPMSFFETTPVGRIINRFSNDIYRVDQVLARTFSQFFGNAFKVLFTLLVISFSTPQFLFFVVPLGALYLYYQRYYLRTSRELKRLDSVSKSPIYAHFQETLDGISTVRAYDQQNRFTFINESRVDLNLKAYFPTVSANRWLAVRLEFIGSVIILAAASLAILTLPTGNLTAGVVGLALSYALQITQSLNWIVRMTVEVETNIVSVERVLEYSQLPSEAPPVLENHRPPASWPSEGAVRFEDYSTRYRPELGLVLKNINLSIKPQEKIGIVGRTGAGKSSLTLALFRIIEASGGHISIDDLDTATIGLRDLRQRLSIIPQDSQAFEGTIRDNLDPESKHDDTELWRVLELSHLKDHVAELEGQLEGKVHEGGSNLSVGQRQLMCLARALLTPSKVLVLDEATAAVDVETDQLLQETIRREFKDRTILTIAHRLNTIMDSDRIVVLDQGEVREFDDPQALLRKKDSMFYALCKQGGFVSDDEEGDGQSS